MRMKEKKLIVILPISILIMTIIVIIIGTLIGNISLANRKLTIEKHRYLDATYTTQTKTNSSQISTGNVIIIISMIILIVTSIVSISKIIEYRDVI